VNRPLLLDTFCGAGGCTKGYQRAGFYVVGVDIEPQPHYCGDEFYQADALEFIAEHGHEYDVIHASPPCQAYSVTRSLHDNEYPDLVEPTRAVLQATGKPYVIENVPGAPLRNYVMLCGTMFGLLVIRHRLFECSPAILMAPRTCHHWGHVSNKGTFCTFENGADFLTVTGGNFLKAEASQAMAIDWMTKADLAQAIPPAYTEWIGRQLLDRIKEEAQCLDSD
jgi:DNA (cytosine-5)-methyltransferase 1